jgi:hypothetical protein
MKALTIILMALFLSAGVAAAQDLTGFTTMNYPGPGVSPDNAKRAPNPNVVLKPKMGGIFVDGAKYGAVMISPFAPASYGIGQKYLAAPSTGTDLQHESAAAAHRDTGGVKVVTFEF